MRAIMFAACGLLSSTRRRKILFFATGKLHRVQDIVELAFKAAGLDWQKYVRQEKQLFRPADPRQVVDNAAKAKQVLGWQPEISFEQIITEMVQVELRAFDL